MKTQYFSAILMVCICFACESRDDSKLDMIAASNGAFAEKQKEQNKDEMHADTATVPTPPPPKQEEPKEETNKLIDWDKKIIKTGSLAIEVKDYKTYRKQLTEFVRSHGAYIAGEQETQTDERLENRITIKVPVGNFQDLIDDLDKTAGKLSSKEITSQDVTTEVVDTKSRIEAKKKIKQRYLDLLTQAKSMEDILSIQSEINEVQEQIEMAEGRANYLNHSSSYSTVNLYYYQVLKEMPGNGSPSFIKRIETAFNTGWDVIKVGLIAAITLWPLWLIGAVFFFVIRKRKPSIAKA